MGYEWNKLSGSVIGQRYRLGELISEHGDSAIFLTDPPEENEFAITEILVGDSQNADPQLHSWSLARSLAHPHLVRMGDAGEDSLNEASFIYGVKERAEECLADVLITRALTLEEAHQVVEAILLSLEYLHENAFIHGAINPSSIVAVSGRVKLAADTITRSTRSRFLAARDMYSLGACVVEVLTRKRLDIMASTMNPEDNTSVTALPSPFREIAVGCLHPDETQRWTPGQCLEALSGAVQAPTLFTHTVRKRIVVRPVSALAMLICGVMFIWIVQRPAHIAKRAYDPVQDDRPSPIPQQGTAERTSLNNSQTGPDAIVPSRVSTPGGTSNWGVIAATYRDFDLAQRFADSLQRRWTGFVYGVYPPKGQAQKYYYVVLGSGLTQDAAQRLQERATAAGLPFKSYVTKIPSSPPLH